MQTSCGAPFRPGERAGPSPLRRPRSSPDQEPDAECNSDGYDLGVQVQEIHHGTVLHQVVGAVRQRDCCLQPTFALMSSRLGHEKNASPLRPIDSPFLTRIFYMRRLTKVDLHRSEMPIRCLCCRRDEIPRIHEQERTCRFARTVRGDRVLAALFPSLAARMLCWRGSARRLETLGRSCACFRRCSSGTAVAWLGAWGEPQDRIAGGLGGIPGRGRDGRIRRCRRLVVRGTNCGAIQCFGKGSTAKHRSGLAASFSQVHGVPGSSDERRM